MSDDILHKILKKYWGYDSFRSIQLDVIKDVCNGEDCIALMPTGGGKSITYQVPALALEGICIVITPLISLMKDQVDALAKIGIKSYAIHSGLRIRDIDIILDNCIYGNYKFLYVSPERVETELFRARFSKMKVSLIAVDEAHCISQWGYDFRPSYLNIAKIRELSPSTPILAVTATATPMVVKDIQDKLLFKSYNLHQMSFARDNLSFLVRHVDDKNSHLLKIINSIHEPGIVYCRTRKECEKVSGFLNSHNITSDFYHGGVSYQLRSLKQDLWLKEEVKVMVATNAFGMGIDKSNVRYVVHYKMSDSLESYYQEAGRAGRDGKSSYAIVLCDKNEANKISSMTDRLFPDKSEIKHIYSLLCNYFDIAIGENINHSYKFDIIDFCSKFKIYSTTVLNAIRLLEICNYIKLSEPIDIPTRIKFIVSRDELYRIQMLRGDLEGFIKILLRLYPGLFSLFVSIDEKHIALMSGYSEQFVEESIKNLRKLKVLQHIPKARSPMIQFYTERLSEDNLRISPEAYALRKKSYQDRLKATIDYIESKNCCRSLMLQNYFGEETRVACGRCDICRGQKKTINQDEDYIESTKRLILGLLSNNPVDIKELSYRIKVKEDIIIHALEDLFRAKMIEQSSNGEIITISNRVKINS